MDPVSILLWLAVLLTVLFITAFLGVGAFAYIQARKANQFLDEMAEQESMFANDLLFERD